MSICMFDNPVTMARELWIDGKLSWHMTASAMAQVPRGRSRPEPFVSGLATGDPEAIAPEYSTHVNLFYAAVRARL